MTIGAIILAAGSSRRFGSDKRKSILDTGKSVLLTCIEVADACFGEVLVVLRSGDHEYAAELATIFNSDTVSCFCAPDSAKGMAHSLANAIATVRTWQAATVFLGDMPYLKRQTIKLLLERYAACAADEPIVVPTKDGKRGHPVVFHGRFFDEVEKLEGDIGARAILLEYSDKVIEVPVDDQGIFQDIDTPADL